MSPNEWAGLTVSVVTIVSALAMGVRHLVKHFLSELKPNGGSSLRDSVDRLDEKVEFLTELVLQSLKK
jgi:hypothetical protein